MRNKNQSEFRNPHFSGGVFPVFNDNLIGACQFFQFHIDGILSGRFKGFTNIIRTNRKFPVSPIDQYCQFNPAGPPQVQQNINGCPYRSSRKKDIVHQEDMLIFYGKMNLRFLHLGCLGQPGPVIPVKSDIDRSRGKINPFFFENLLS